MQKVKLCPVCGTKNEPTRMECIGCEADLTRTAITDENADAPRSADPAPCAEKVRVCECGTKNPANARKCISCGEDLSDIAPTEQAEAGAYVLTSLDGLYAFRVGERETLIGRESAMAEYLAGRAYVSRRHAKLTLERGELFAEDLNSMNHTFINGKAICEKTKMEDGDELSLGGVCKDGTRQEGAAYFALRREACI